MWGVCLGGCGCQRGGEVVSVGESRGGCYLSQREDDDGDDDGDVDDDIDDDDVDVNGDDDDDDNDDVDDDAIVITNAASSSCFHNRLGPITMAMLFILIFVIATFSANRAKKIIMYLIRSRCNKQS